MARHLPRTAMNITTSALTQTTIAHIVYSIRFGPDTVMIGRAGDHSSL